MINKTTKCGSLLKLIAKLNQPAGKLPNKSSELFDIYTGREIHAHVIMTTDQVTLLLFLCSKEVINLIQL